jgi:hypothetical protein
MQRAGTPQPRASAAVTAAAAAAAAAEQQNMLLCGAYTVIASIRSFKGYCQHRLTLPLQKKPQR